MYSLLFIVISASFYYFRPLPASDIFRELDDVVKISIDLRFYDGKQEVILLELVDKEVKTFQNFLNLTKYQRAFGSTNLKNQANDFEITMVLHNSDNYSISINDTGKVVVFQRKGAKKYRILSSKEDVLFKLIAELVRDQNNRHFITIYL